MNVSFARPGLGLIRSLPGALGHRWPALAVASVAVALPMGVAFASVAEEGPTKFLAGGAGSDEVAVLASGYNRTGVYATSFSNTALEAVSGQLSQLAIYARGNATGIQAEGNSTGVRAHSANGVGVNASGKTIAVNGASEAGYAVMGQSTTGTGVFAHSVNGVGIDASSDTNTAVKVASASGYGVDASTKKTAVLAHSSDSSGVAASSGATNGVAVSAYADRKGSIGVNAFGDSTGVYAEGTTGVVGRSNVGLGAEFSGPEAPIRLVPSARPGAPTTGTHKTGELYVDSQGQLFLCVAESAGGNAGTWKQVALK